MFIALGYSSIVWMGGSGKEFTVGPIHHKIMALVPRKGPHSPFPPEFHNELRNGKKGLLP